VAKARVAREGTALRTRVRAALGRDPLSAPLGIHLALRFVKHLTLNAVVARGVAASFIAASSATGEIMVRGHAGKEHDACALRGRRRHHAS